MNRLRASSGGQGGVGWSPNGAALDLWFARDLYASYGMRLTLDEATDFTRASAADWLNPANDGLSPQVLSNVLRRDGRGALIEESRTNQIRNNTMAGASAGNPPTLWSVPGTVNGLTATIVGRGVSSGIDYVRIRWQGTATTTTLSNFIFFDSNSQFAASNGQTWAASALFALNAGSLSGATPSLRLRYNDSGGVLLTSQDASLSAMTSTLASFPVSLTAANASTAFANLALVISLTAGTVYDFTIDVACPQLEQASSVLSPIPTSGASATRAADVLTSAVNLSGDFTAVIIPRPTALATSRALLSLDDGTSNNVFLLRNGSADASAAVYQATTAGVGQSEASTATGALVVNARSCIAIRRSGSQQAISQNGGALITVTPTLPSVAMTRLGIGNVNGGFQQNGFVERVIVFPTAVNDATLQQYATLGLWGG